jgi:hypothetical protein
MLMPLLVSSLAIIVAFVPLVAGETETGEYMRSLGSSLRSRCCSLLLALTITPLLAMRYIRVDAHHDEDAGFLGKVKRFYGGLVERSWHGRWRSPAAWWAARHSAGADPVRAAGTASAVAAQAGPDADRTGTGRIGRTDHGDGAKVSTTLHDRTLFPEVTSHITYVADGGPRFILGLNPPAPTLNRAYAVINLTKAQTWAKPSRGWTAR